MVVLVLVFFCYNIYVIIMFYMVYKYWYYGWVFEWVFFWVVYIVCCIFFILFIFVVLCFGEVGMDILKFLWLFVFCINFVFSYNVVKLWERCVELKV